MEEVEVNLCFWNKTKKLHLCNKNLCFWYANPCFGKTHDFDRYSDVVKTAYVTGIVKSKAVFLTLVSQSPLRFRAPTGTCFPSF